MRRCLVLLGACLLAGHTFSAQTRTQTPDWSAVDTETLTHFQALVRIDSSDPPGNELPVVNYLKAALEKEGIPVETFQLEPNRPNLVARLKGNGSKRPILVMAHTDTVNIDPSKWVHGPFSADRDGGYIYGRGSLDNKSTLVTGLMLMLTLKRLNVPLDRDVIFLAESGEEGTTRVGIDFMVKQHFDAIDAEYCFAEGGEMTREGGQMRYASVQTTEKNPRTIELISKGTSGHASRPLDSNAIVHLATAIEKIGTWQPPISLNETTGTYFRRLAQISPPAKAQMYRDVLDPQKAKAADKLLKTNEPAHSAMLHFTLSPTLIQAGIRLNVIPSEAKGTVDIRLMPDDDPAKVLDQVKQVVNDSAVTVQWAVRDVRPIGISRMDTEGYKSVEGAITRTYKVPTLPTMGTGGTDMSYLRGKGMQCYGLGVGRDAEDVVKGFAQHADPERVLESEIYQFVRLHWDFVNDLARAR